MPLKLRVVSDHYKQLGKTSSQLFGVTGGSIGRAPDNDWILPDPDRYVSSHHAKVSFRAGNWILEDVSTNGVFVNDSDTPLAVNGPRKLKDGDRLRFGDYDIIVSIDGHNDFSPDASGQMPAPPRVRRSKAASGSFRQSPGFGDDLGEDLDITGLLVSGKREAEDQTDAVAAFDKSQRFDKPAPAARAPASTVSVLDSFLDEPQRAAVPDDRGEDWHMTTRRIQQRKPAAAQLQAVPAPVPVQAPPPPVLREVAPVRESVREPVREQVRESAREPVRESLHARAEPERARKSGDGLSELQAGVEALCRGAGIDPGFLPADAQAALLSLAGQMLREVVLDLMEALRGRGEDKSRMRVGQTTIQPAHNNPLKFSASVEEALRKLLDGHSSRYLGPVEALREAFSDLKNHQIAMDAGMHSALNDLLSRVDPTELQERFDRGLKRSPLLGAVNKSKYWDLYCDFYPLLNQRDTRGWPAIFTEAFTQTYAEKIENLEKRKK